jgi:hypothetical protein
MLIRAGLRIVALVWLLAIAPADLAVTTGRLLPRLTADPDLALAAVIAARGLAVALGMAIGLGIWRRQSASSGLAALWALLELGTLAIVLGSPIVPTNRLPGTVPLIATAYVALVAVVLAAVRTTDEVA